MIALAGGRFRMGADDSYPEERPVHEAVVEAFEIDETPVTVAAFAEFVGATGYVTTAETAPDPADYPDVDPALLVPGSLVFTPPDGPVPLDDVRRWWTWLPGANWRRAEGPDHPVTHVSHTDALAYARWAGKDLPTEAEWEFAARGGLDRAPFAWGDDPDPAGRANTWIGEFPWQRLGLGTTSAVGSYPRNGYGLADMTGNVWEWTADRYRAGPSRTRPCCAPGAGDAATHVIKGGSHLCAPNYCLRYRPAARQPQSADSSTGHLGFRCVRRPR